MELSPHLVWRLGAVAPLVAACIGCTLYTDLDGLSGDSTTSATSGAGGSDPQGAVANAVAVTAGPGPGPGAGGAGGGRERVCMSMAADYRSLVLNELAPDGEPDWIELENCGSAPLSLCGVTVTQDYDGATLQPGSYYTFADDEVLEPGALRVIHRDVDFPFGLSKDTVERFTLLGPALELIDQTEWDAASLPFDTAHSWARVPDCQGAFVKTSPPSEGATNN